MTKTKPLWQPRYSTTPAIVQRLLEIEAVRTAFGMMALPPAVETELRRQARLHSTHYSTRIEGEVGLLITAAESKRNQAYGLTAIYRQYLDGLTAMGAE